MTCHIIIQSTPLINGIDDLIKRTCSVTGISGRVGDEVRQRLKVRGGDRVRNGNVLGRRITRVGTAVS